MDEAQEAQLMDYAQSYMRPPIDKYSGIILQLTDPTPEMKELENKLRRRVVDKEGVAHQIGTPILNEAGINSVMGLVHSVVWRGAIMSKLTDVEIEKLTVDVFVDTLIEDLMTNKVAYGVNGNELTGQERSTITAMASMSVYTSLKRAQDGNEKWFLRSVSQEITTNSTTENKSGKSWLQRLNPFGGK